MKYKNLDKFYLNQIFQEFKERHKDDWEFKNE